MKKLIVILSVFLFLSSYAYNPTQEDVQRFSAYYSNGMQYFKNAQFSSAIVEFKKVLRFSPYDITVQDALINAYLARAHYYNKTTKEYKKALNDYKSAYFYAKNWKDGQMSTTIAQGANSALGEIKDLEKKLQIAQNDQTRFSNAKTLKAQGELAAAGYDFSLLIKVQYKESAYENLSNIYKNLNNISKGLDSIKTAIDINPKNPKLHFLYGVMLDDAKNFEASIEQYNLALEYGDKSPELMGILENKWTQMIVNNPNDSNGYINLGAIYQKTGNLEGAKKQYLKASQLNPNDETSLYNLASLYTSQKDYSSAILVYDQLLTKNPKNIEVMTYRASALKELKRYEEALNQYQTILSIDSNNQIAKSNEDDIILNHFSGEKLQNYLKQKALSNPNNYEAQFNYALELHKKKNYTEAIDYYKKALSINPSKEEVYLNLAQIYLEENKFDSAYEICQKGLVVLPNNKALTSYLEDSKNYKASSQYNSATKLFEQKNYKAALSEYLKISNKTKEVKLAIASCYWSLNDFKNANKYYLEVLQTDPNNTEVLINSAWAYYSLADYTNAKLSANKILALDKTNKEALDLLNSIQESEFSSVLQTAIEKYEQKDYTTSMNLINKVLQKNPDDEFGLYYKGLNLDEMKNPKEAIKTYKQLILKHPQFLNAYYNLALSLDTTENYKEAVINYEKFINLKGSEKDELTEFSRSRVKELKEYLQKVNGKSKTN